MACNTQPLGIIVFFYTTFTKGPKKAINDAIKNAKDPMRRLIA